MDLSKIVAISGKPGLYKIKSQAVGRIIVESLTDGKCVPVFANDRISSLEEISIFSTEEDRMLKDVFTLIHNTLGDTLDFNYKKDSPDVISKKFGTAMPDYEPDAVHISDMRKVFAWYQMLTDKGLLDYTETTKEEKKEETKE